MLQSLLWPSRCLITRIQSIYKYMYIDYIFLIIHPDDDHRNYHNILVKNNVWLKL